MAITSIVPIIDRSDSMSLENKLPAAQTDTCTFINAMQSTDKLAVVAFSDDSSVIYPANASTVATITGQPTIDAACAAIQALGTLSTTNIKAAITQAQGLLASEADPRGILLLSDGLWNTGGDPTQNLATKIPIYTIALGNSFNHSFMESISSQTNGTYNYSPDAFQLSEIYNDIVSEMNVAAVVANKKMQTKQDWFSTTPVQIAQATANAYYAVSWIDTSIQYTPGTPSGKQLTVRLISPNGQPSGLTPTGLGLGFVVFKLPSPTPGMWQVEIWNSVPGGVQTSVGVYEPNSSIMMGLRLDSSLVQAGNTLRFTAPVTDGGEPLRNVQVTATLEHPMRPLSQTLDMYKDELARVAPPRELLEDGVPEPLARLSTLEAEAHTRATNFHPRLVRPVPTPSMKGRSKAYVGTIADIPHEGEYTLRITATGYSPVSKTFFTRQRRISFLASSQK